MSSNVISFVFMSLVITATAQRLTQLIKENRTNEAKNASWVDPTAFLNITSYAGHLTVDERYNSNMFFWYFPAIGKPVDKTPWIIWLQGGPGATSLYGLFDEFGPFKYNKRLKKLELRESSWGRDFSLLFIDNPIGAGFSYTDNNFGMSYTMKECSQHLYATLQQFLMIFPELRQAPLYIAGESYAGLYVPAFAMEVLQSEIKGLEVNFQGIILGNPSINRKAFANYSAIFYTWGLVDEQGVLTAKDLQDSYFKALENGNVTASRQLHDDLLDKLGGTAFQTTTYNILKTYPQLGEFREFVNENKDKLHVGSRTFEKFSNKVWYDLVPTFLDKAQPSIEKLLDRHRVLIYCGQLDLTTPCVPAAAPRRHEWRWRGRRAFLAAPRTPWWFNGTVAGFVKSGGGFTEVLVKGAGHLVPIDKPFETQRLISSFILNKNLPAPPNYLVNNTNTPSLDEYYHYINTTKSIKQETRDKENIEVPSKTSEKIVDQSSNVPLTISVSVNVILVLAMIVGVVYYFKWKRRYDDYFQSTDDYADDSILTIERL